MKKKIYNALEYFLDSFKYLMMYFCGAIIAAGGTENRKNWIIAAAVWIGIYLILFAIWITLGESIDNELYEQKENEEIGLDRSIDKDVDYRIIGNTFNVKIRCPEQYLKTVKPLLEEFAEEMFKAEEIEEDEKI